MNNICIECLIPDKIASKPNNKSSSSNMALDMQRALEMQRQYLEMLSQAQQMPNQRGGHSNWKNN